MFNLTSVGISKFQVFSVVGGYFVLMAPILAVVSEILVICTEYVKRIKKAPQKTGLLCPICLGLSTVEKLLESFVSRNLRVFVCRLGNRRKLSGLLLFPLSRILLFLIDLNFH